MNGIALRRQPPRPDEATRTEQARAANPQNAAWVQANAGSGKTYVLSTRVIRLLLNGIPPAKILCLTYTKTAAAEMKNRVFQRLGEWVMLDDGDLRKAIENVTGLAPTLAECDRARTLFAAALETPGGLKVQTIHAFCESLLRRFPLEANIAGHFEQLEGDAQDALIEEARRLILIEPPVHARHAIEQLIVELGESKFDDMLKEITAKRRMLTEVLIDDEPVQMRENWYARFGFSAMDSEATVSETLLPLPGLSIEIIRTIAALGTEFGLANTIKIATGLTDAMQIADPVAAVDGIFAQLFKQDGDRRKASSAFGKKVHEAMPDLVDLFEKAQAHAESVRDRLTLYREVEFTFNVLTLADTLIDNYERLKRQRGFLDFDDLINRTETLLRRPDVGPWVRYKLDAGIDHILLDEAQDTSPAQWQVIKSIAGDFFAGESAQAQRRTIFAVGDEKQSIYSFQGADPRAFADSRDHFGHQLESVERKLELVPLQASFRSAPDILSAVDVVFETPEHHRGLTSRNVPPSHTSLRVGDPGHVEIWERIKSEKAPEQIDWTKPVEASVDGPLALAERIAAEISRWLQNGETLEATGQPVTPGDILVLVRKRDRFVPALSLALKDKAIPVAGADRLAMTNHIAILDLLSLGRFALLPDDDLSLAEILKSPIVGWSEDDLFALAHPRGEATLYEAIREKGNAGDQRFIMLADRLAGWIRRAASEPPFEFYGGLLSRENIRASLIARLGAETPDMLDEFLNVALTREKSGVSSMQSFIESFEGGGPEIKREMDHGRGEVRIMTVHGAKGLEAPIVFLIDPGSAAVQTKSLPDSAEVEIDEADNLSGRTFLWKKPGQDVSAPLKAERDKASERAEDEYRRLLYVAMTRAADRLIVTGYQSLQPPKTLTWFDMVSAALVPHPLTTIERSYDFQAWRYKLPTTGDCETGMPAARQANAADEAFDLPEWFSSRVKAEPPAPRPLAPSGASSLAIEAGETAADTGAIGTLPPSVSLLGADASDGGHATSAHNAARRGIAIHRLLQMLPTIELSEREERAGLFCERLHPDWDQAAIASICKPVLDILGDQRFAAFFSPNGRAEVPVMGTITVQGLPRAVSGVIDRMVVDRDAGTVWIIDYKTNYTVPRMIEDVPPVYIRQMALYRALVEPLYPDLEVRAALLFTGGPHLLELPASTLEAAIGDVGAAD